ncbi:5'/3'-nucleotidase SurE [Cryptococcus floricola]|uniref:5'/3'-nucleotidase SurE n=1 Tax=Cryptococcus floricola TaxID=2591691 RepID=A0A5D3B4B9_9TREE|nr:5'/3'-nucleotidase SurE [Cryptococcus floricola]
MAPLPTYTDRPVVLLTNDDGPPCASSPNIFSFCKLLQSKLGWDVRVVIPDCQKSWVGKAYAISDVIAASYFYPLEPDGLHGDITTERRPLKEGETMEWVLLSGTPATCANVALHNIYPGEIDLVVSGPNHGRNSSTAFALSSGTLGAALAASLSIPIPGPSSRPSLHETHIPSIAVSYGVVTRPVSARLLELATETAVDVCQRLFNSWGEDDGPGGKGLVPIYSVNVPLVEANLEEGARKVCFTDMWRNAYGGLFKVTQLDPSLSWWSNESKPKPGPQTKLVSAAASTASLHTVQSDRKCQGQPQASSSDNHLRSKVSFDPGDHAASWDQRSTTNQPQNVEAPLHSKSSAAGPNALPTSTNSLKTSAADDKQLKFHFAPNMKPLLFPDEKDVPEGTDAWAFAKGWTSVTPMRAEYACVAHGNFQYGKLWE